MKRTIFVMILTASLFSCAAINTPFSLVEGGWGKTIKTNYYDVLMTKVDGVNLINKKSLLRLEPGVHEIRVVSTKVDPTPRDQKSYADFSLNAKPCIKYYLSAHHENELSLEMTVEVTKEQNIEDCGVTKNRSD